MIETHQLMAALIEGVGAKQVAHATNRSLGHVYRLAADPMAIDTPVANDLDRIGTAVDLMAARPHAAWALEMWETHFIDLFDRAINRREVTALTCDGIPARVEVLCREFADVLHECKKDFVPDNVARQASELMAELRLLVRCAERADDAPAKPRTPKLAS